MSVKWHRSWFPARFAYCPSEKEFRKELAKSTDPHTTYPETAGCTIVYRNSEKELCILVTVSCDWDEEPQVAMGVLVHECVHVVEAIIQEMEDEYPSDEFRAYSTQAVFCELLEDISEYRRKNSKS